MSGVQFKNTAGEDLVTRAQGRQVTVEGCLFADLDRDYDLDILHIMMIASRWNSRVGDQLYDQPHDFDDDIDIVDVMRLQLGGLDVLNVPGDILPPAGVISLCLQYRHPSAPKGPKYG